MQIHTVTTSGRVEQQNHPLVPRDGVLSTHSDMGRSDDAPVTPHIACCECGCELEAKYQEPMFPGGRSFFLVTCLTTTCRMQGFTLADCNYPPANLEVYLTDKQRKAERREGEMNAQFFERTGKTRAEFWGESSEWHR